MEKNIDKKSNETLFGLTQEQVKQNTEKYGKNVLKTRKRPNIFILFLKQFADFMIILLLIAWAFSMGVAIYQAVNPTHQTNLTLAFIEPNIILVVVALNAMLGVYQEVKSDQAVRALEANNELICKVIRDGILVNIPAVDVTIGDLIVLEAGDSIPADAKLIEAFNLSVVESALTGESLPVEKRVGEIENIESLPLGDRYNHIFSGTYVTNGRGIAVVTGIGETTEIGKINKSLQEQEIPLSPLQIKLNKLSKIFGISGVVLLFVTTILQIVLTNTITGNWQQPAVYSNALLIGISLAVAAIPEGLITFTTVLLAIGVSRMTKAHAIIKAIPAVETLGSTNIICTDKTGTLTQNKMTVVKFFDKIHNDVELTNSQALGSLVACCDAQVTIDENGNYVEVGDPTETAILRYGLENNNSKEKFYTRFNKLYSLPFDSDRKTMSVLVSAPDGSKIMITKGAPDVIFNKSNKIDQSDIELNHQWSNDAIRVIAVAYKRMPNETTEITHDDENHLTFAGLIGMIDPPRENVKESIIQARKAGIKTIMITGDHLNTATAIGKSLTIYDPEKGDLAIDGVALANMSDEELKNKVEHITVYARVNPSDKLRIVKAWQSHQQVVAMTGDGVNDAPALKASDIGCAMGITGTDVSKQAADVILTDDNFNTIVHAVKTGRETFDRIKTVILNLLVSSVSEIIVMLVGMFAFRWIFRNQFDNATGEFIILSASQLLWINLLTHGLPAIALGMVPNQNNVMLRKPFNKNDSIFAYGMGKRLIIQSLILSFFALLSYLVVALVATSNQIKGENFIQLTSSAAFITLGVGASINSINLMSDNSILKCNVMEFKLVYLASAFSLICMLISAFVPGINRVFGNVEYGSVAGGYKFAYWFVPIIFSFGLLIYEESVKWFNYYKAKNANKQSLKEN
ncbi:cation-translocating P-type ATPase [Mycoplasma sp. Pen4]|uniref:cation-translocating P-type ATPase n=1 Tax=Mycoplasma sp. Pen4 TaxID=640330 RepID=UPI00165408AB|nr:cation-translocating P-type ATPase [Mycoplasma sp. Pen4]QNM93545.1 cation-translocating P-type ATPase [Mycoplasma sp. Pen4]